MSAQLLRLSMETPETRADNGKLRIRMMPPGGEFRRAVAVSGGWLAHLADAAGWRAGVFLLSGGALGVSPDRGGHRAPLTPRRAGLHRAGRLDQQGTDRMAGSAARKRPVRLAAAIVAGVAAAALVAACSSPGDGAAGPARTAITSSRPAPTPDSAVTSPSAAVPTPSPSPSPAAVPPGSAALPVQAAAAGARLVTFVNQVSQTIWVAASPDAGHPLAATGWVLPAGQSVTITVPNQGTAVVACESACTKFGTDQYCCRGAWAPRSQCDPARWPVDYAAVFKKAEPYAYSYVDDDATSVFTCQGRCDYQITFGVTPPG
jgi:Thaumatin family